MGNTSSSDFVSGADIGVWRAVAGSASTALSVLEPRDLTSVQAESVLVEVLRVERAAAAARVLLAKRVADGEQWRRDGFASAAEWLAAKSGTSTGRARDDLKTSERLGGLADTAEAMRQGQLSPEQAGAVADAAVANPAAERDLLGVAGRESLSGLRDEAARRKAEAEDVAARERRIRRDRRCRTWTDRDGAWNLSARGPAADGAAFLVELERLTNEAFHSARRAGVPEGRDAYGFDAMMAMAARSHARTASAPTSTASPPTPTPPTKVMPEPSLFDAAVDNLPAPATAPATAPASGDRPPVPGDPPQRENLRHLALLHVDLSALVRGQSLPGERCEIPGVGSVSVDTARELLGESILKLVISNGVDVLNVTHLGRGPSMAQQVALLWAQPRCSVAGCNRRARLQVDHRLPFSTDRVTELRNLDPLCEHHHDRKTRHGWALVDGTGRRAMVAPGDARHPGQPPPTPRQNAPPGAA